MQDEQGTGTVVSMCELGGVVCTLLYLFNLRRFGAAGYSGMSTDETHKQILFTFASVAITIVTATVKTVGVSKVVKAVRSAAASAQLSSFRMAAGPSRLLRPHSGTVRPTSERDEEAENQDRKLAVSEGGLLTNFTDMPNTLDQGQDGDVMQSSVRRPSVAGMRPGGASEI